MLLVNVRSGCRLLRASLAAALIGLPTVGVSGAHASYDPIGSGTATIALSRDFVAALAKGGLSVVGRQGARVNGSRILFGNLGGRADPARRKCQIEPLGEVALVGHGYSLPLKQFALVTKATPLIARLGGGQLKIARAADVKLIRRGFGSRLEASSLRLTAKAANRLNRRLHTGVFTEGMLLGALHATAQPATLALLARGAASIHVDPSLLTKLDADSTPVNPIFPAEGGESFVFPVGVEGRISPDGRAGEIRMAGGIELLRLEGGQIFWKDPRLEMNFSDMGGSGSQLSVELDLEPQPSYEGKVGRTAVLLADLASAGISSDPSRRSVAIANLPLSLSAPSAGQFNSAFAGGRADFSAGDSFGTLTVEVQTQ